MVLGPLALTGVGLLGPDRAGAAPPEAPTVSFGATEDGCGSRPEVSHLAVPGGTPVLLVNGTPGPVTVQVDGAIVPGQPVAAGEGVALTLDSGQHQVKLAPACGLTEPLTVLVAAAAVAVPTTLPPSPVARTAEPSPPPSAGTTRPSTTVSSVPTDRGTGMLAPVADVGAVGPTGTAARPVVPGVLGVSTVGLASGSNPKGVRLLAAIATICVLGVTAAIIRAIVRLSP